MASCPQDDWPFPFYADVAAGCEGWFWALGNLAISGSEGGVSALRVIYLLGVTSLTGRSQCDSRISNRRCSSFL